MELDWNYWHASRGRLKLGGQTKAWIGLGEAKDKETKALNWSVKWIIIIVFFNLLKSKKWLLFLQS